MNTTVFHEHKFPYFLDKYLGVVLLSNMYIELYKSLPNYFPMWLNPSAEATFQIKGGGGEREAEVLEAEVSPQHSYVYFSQNDYEVDTNILRS